MRVDLLLTNATFLTMDARQPTASALAIADGRIAWIGDPADAPIDVRKRVDLGGATVLPGFNDAHHHLLLLGQWLLQVDCSFPAVKSIDDIIAAVATAAGDSPPDAWIEARPSSDGMDPRSARPSPRGSPHLSYAPAVPLASRPHC